MRGRVNKQVDKAKQKETARLYDDRREQYKQKLDKNDYPGSMSLVFELDVPVVVIMKGGETVTGTLMSFDHFGTVVLSGARYGTSGMSMQTCIFQGDDIVLVGHLKKQKDGEDSDDGE